MALSNGPNLGVLVDGGIGETHYNSLMAQWRAFDGLIQARVVSHTLTTPPTTPIDGACYIVPTGSTGVWSTHTNKIARYSSKQSAWEFYTPKVGWFVYSESISRHLAFKNGSWSAHDIDKADLINGKIPSNQLPSFVDDVVEFDTFEDLPEIGESGKIYVTLDSNNSWRWTGSTYQKVSQPLDEMPQAVAEAGTSETLYAATARRIHQAITAWWLTASSAFGRTLANVADAAAGRTALDLGTIATQDANNINLTFGTMDGVTIGQLAPAPGVFTTLRATGQIRSDSSFVAAAGTPVYLGNTEDASVVEVSSPSPAVLKLKTAYQDTFTVSALTGNKSHTPLSVDTAAGANYQLFQQTGVLKAITGSEASIFGTNPNNYGTYLYEGGAEYFIATNGGKVFRATPSGLWGYGDFSLGQAGARVAYLPNDSLTYEGRAYANYGMSAHPELVGLSGFNGVGLFAAGVLRAKAHNKGVDVNGSLVTTGYHKLQRTVYGICSCELSPNEKVNGFKLKTTIPYGDNTFFKVRLHGYDYRSAAVIDLSVVLYNYSGGIIQGSAASAGGWIPTVRAASEGGALVLHFGLQQSDGYYAHFDVDATFFAMPANDPRTEGWTFVDEALTGTGQVTIPCVNRMVDLRVGNSAFIQDRLTIGTGASPSSPHARIVAAGTTDPGIQLASTNNGGGLILGTGGGGLGFYTYTGAIGAETYTLVASLSDVAFSKLGGHANQNPNPGAETPYAGSAYEWSAFNSGYQGYLWRAQAVQPAGAYVNYADLVFSNPITGEVLRVKPAGLEARKSLKLNNDYAVNQRHGVQLSNSQPEGSFTELSAAFELVSDSNGNYRAVLSSTVNGVKHETITMVGPDVTVAGVVTAKGATAIDVNTAFESNASASGLTAYHAQNNGGYGAFFGYDNIRYSGGAAMVRNIANTPLVFETNNTECGRFDQNGNLGLGITPSAWAGFKAYQVIGGAIASGTGLYNNLLVASNAYYNGSGYTYIGNEPATLYRQLTGVHAWYSASAGNAGDPISFTQAMTLDAVGNLGLGVIPSQNWFGSRKVVAINSGGAALTGVTDGTAEVWGNAMLTAPSGDAVYVNNGCAAVYQVNRSGWGAHAWFTAPYGSAGTAAPLTQAMTLDAAGVLAIAALPANDFPNDAAAAADGIPIGGLYHTAGTVKVRLT